MCIYNIIYKVYIIYKLLGVYIYIFTHRQTIWYIKDITALGHAALLVALSSEPEILFIDRHGRGIWGCELKTDQLNIYVYIYVYVIYIYITYMYIYICNIYIYYYIYTQLYIYMYVRCHGQFSAFFSG